jgi:hypothetical protein
MLNRKLLVLVGSNFGHQNQHQNFAQKGVLQNHGTIINPTCRGNGREVAVGFAEWMAERYEYVITVPSKDGSPVDLWRLIDSNGDQYTTSELFELFINENNHAH